MAVRGKGKRIGYSQNTAATQIPIVLLGTKWYFCLLHPPTPHGVLCVCGGGGLPQTIQCWRPAAGSPGSNPENPTLCGPSPSRFLSWKCSAHPSSQGTMPTPSPEGQDFTDIYKYFIGWWNHLESASFLSPRYPWKHRSKSWDCLVSCCHWQPLLHRPWGLGRHKSKNLGGCIFFGCMYVCLTTFLTSTLVALLGVIVFVGFDIWRGYFTLV